MYLKGTDGICSSAMPGSRSERKRVRVRRNDGYIVSWPIIPLRIGQFKIRVVARTAMGSDVVEKTLYVVVGAVLMIIIQAMTISNYYKRQC